MTVASLGSSSSACAALGLDSLTYAALASNLVKDKQTDKKISQHKGGLGRPHWQCPPSSKVCTTSMLLRTAVSGLSQKPCVQILLDCTDFVALQGLCTECVVTSKSYYGFGRVPMVSSAAHRPQTHDCHNTFTQHASLVLACRPHPWPWLRGLGALAMAMLNVTKSLSLTCSSCISSSICPSDPKDNKPCKQCCDQV